jgi:hypothetical protein
MTKASAAIDGQTVDRKVDGASSDARESDRAARFAESETVIAFDYTQAAELFPTRSRKPRRNSFAYRRFARAADAVRFAIEELPGELLVGAYLEVAEERFGSAGIRRLYDSERFPLKRRAVSR